MSVITAVCTLGIVWPDWQSWVEAISLQDYNTRLVAISVAVLGIAAGWMGSFALFRRRALIGDALAHASLPGIAIAFIVATVVGVDGKSLAVLMTGAILGGAAGAGVILWVQRTTRLKQDAILGVVLSVFFGLGVAILGVIQQMQTGSAAGLETFIYGKTASIKFSDARLILWITIIVFLVSVVFYKEFKLLCFDQAFARSQGLTISYYDALLLVLIIAVTMVGLKAVGLILIVALLIIPPAAARFWTNSLFPMLVLSSLFGLTSGAIGALISALWSNLPSGAIIVLVSTFFFMISVLLGPVRGILPERRRQRRVNREISRLRVENEYAEEPK